MRTMRIFLAALLATSASLGAQATATANKADITGKWSFSVTTSAGTGSPTLTFKQQGDSLTGHYSSQAFGEAELLGTVKDSTVRFSVHVNAQGTALVVTYNGTIEGSDAMKGTVDIGGAATGTFTAKKQ